MITAAALLLAAAAPVPAATAFDQLKQLVGRWRPADRADGSLNIHFYLTAGGTVLVESRERTNGEPHSLTLYHRDGDALIATHYCPQGNQPRLALAGRDDQGLHFTFRDATDLDAGEFHQHDLWLDLTDPNHPIRTEVYRGVGPGAQERMWLVRP
ncbi:hypothetical protein [Sphingomonas sp.]|jgi:hypothetical protein|uniref:hypothetical protein n=1 Tax=Sphingomonas sp. TaxID=28214 RepID=UPI002DEEFDA8|nr:hypothetical protein [Sphingomonas sp.]